MPMNFLYPQLLFGLLALAIPIVIHLFNFRKTKRVYFSNNHFLKNIKDAKKPKYKLKHLLVLFSRLCFVFFLVIAFAQPFIPGLNDEQRSKNVMIYLDNSFSMSNESANGLSSFSLGLRYVNEIVDLYPPNTRFKLLTNDFAPFSNTFKNAKDTKEVLTDIGYSPVSRNLQEINSRLAYDIGTMSAKEDSDIFWISDFQKSAMGNTSGLILDSLANYFIVPVKQAKPNNVFIDSVYLTNPFLISNEQNRIEALIKNAGNESVEDLIVKLFINDMQVANASVDIKPNSHSVAVFDVNFDLKDFNKCRLSFEDFPVTFDNEFFFTLNKGGRVAVLEVNEGQTQGEIRKVFANDKLFDFKSFKVTNLDYSLISGADLVVLNGLNRIDESLLPYLREFLEKEGNLLIIPSAQLEITTYNALVEGSLLMKNQPEKSKLATPDIANPFYSDVFLEKDKAFDMGQAKNVITWSSRANHLITYQNNEPFLSYFSGKGKVYVVGAPFNEEFTSFYKHALFVPVMYKIASLSRAVNEKLYYSLNEQVIKLHIDSLAKNDLYKLQREEKELVPTQRVAGKELILDLPKFLMSPGYYDLTIAGKRKKTLSFNFAKSESLPEQLSQQELLTAFSNRENIKVYDRNDMDGFSKEMQEKHKGVPLWKLAVVLALIFLLTEVLLIRFFKV
jgi:hypothetical protein